MISSLVFFVITLLSFKGLLDVVQEKEAKSSSLAGDGHAQVVLAGGDVGVAVGGGVRKAVVVAQVVGVVVQAGVGKTAKKEGGVRLGLTLGPASDGLAVHVGAGSGLDGGAADGVESGVAGHGGDAVGVGVAQGGVGHAVVVAQSAPQVVVEQVGVGLGGDHGHEEESDLGTEWRREGRN